MAGPGLHTPYRSLAIRAMRLFVRRDLQRCLHWRVVRTYPDKVEACRRPAAGLAFGRALNRSNKDTRSFFRSTPSPCLIPKIFYKIFHIFHHIECCVEH